MQGISFAHPNFCPRLAARRLGAGLLDWIALSAELMSARGRIRWRQHAAASPAAFQMACHRLMKQGLLVAQHGRGGEPRLQLTAAGAQQVSDALHPHRYWDQKWNGVWSVLIYDIPEQRHADRTVLRTHLRRLRMGKLQGSVWIAARDVRPDFADLQIAADLREHALLFAARQVLGQSGAALAQQAWDFGRLQAAHNWFLDTVAAASHQLKNAGRTPAAPWERLRELHAAYLAVMEPDPLLPAALWPPVYLGPQVHRAYLALARELANPP